MARTASAISGRVFTVSGVRKRATVLSTRASMLPPALTASMRCCHKAGSPSGSLLVVSQRTSVRSTLGFRKAMVMPVMPPIDSPTKCVRVICSASSRASTSSASSSKLYGPGRHVGLAVAALVVAQHAILLRERVHLRIPHAVRRRQGVAHGDPGRPLRAIDAVVDLDPVDLDLHRLSSRAVEIDYVSAAGTSGTPTLAPTEAARTASASRSC